MSTRNGASKSRNGVASRHQRTEKPSERDERERQRIEAANKRKGRAERRRADGMAHYFLIKVPSAYTSRFRSFGRIATGSSCGSDQNGDLGHDGLKRDGQRSCGSTRDSDRDSNSDLASRTRQPATRDRTPTSVTANYRHSFPERHPDKDRKKEVTQEEGPKPVHTRPRRRRLACPISIERYSKRRSHSSRAQYQVEWRPRARQRTWEG